jgi:hypothetical protein
MGVRAELQDVEELEVVGRGRALTGEAEFHQDFINREPTPFGYVFSHAFLHTIFIIIDAYCFWMRLFTMQSAYLCGSSASNRSSHTCAHLAAA